MNDHIKRIKSQLLADKRKLSIMVGLLAVAMLMWGRLLLQKVPRTATAEPVAAVVTADTPVTAASAAVIRPVVHLPQTQPLQRDLFALEASHYQRVAEVEDDTVRVAKSPQETVDDSAVARMVHEAAGRLTLQSIIQGARPRAMINGQLLALGQKIEGFTVSQIDQRHVILTRSGVDVKLAMN